jgi:hypothetical protein
MEKEEQQELKEMKISQNFSSVNSYIGNYSPPTENE